MELAKYGILQKVVAEFKKQGLEVKYQKEIEAWRKYKREKEFAIRIEKEILDEVERFINSRK